MNTEPLNRIIDQINDRPAPRPEYDHCTLCGSAMSPRPRCWCSACVRALRDGTSGSYSVQRDRIEEPVTWGTILRIVLIVAVGLAALWLFYPPMRAVTWVSGVGR